MEFEKFGKEMIGATVGFLRLKLSPYVADWAIAIVPKW